MNTPHTTDVPLKEIVDLILRINAQAYSIEAANPRHEHEWMVWKDVKLPEGKILIPGIDQPPDERGRASRAGGLADQELRLRRRQRERHRQHRLRLRAGLEHDPRASGGAMGEARALVEGAKLASRIYGNSRRTRFAHGGSPRLRSERTRGDGAMAVEILDDAMLRIAPAGPCARAAWQRVWRAARSDRGTGVDTRGRVSFCSATSMAAAG